MLSQKEKEATNKYYRNNKQKVAIKNKKWRINNKNRWVELGDEWRKNNRIRDFSFRALAHKRRKGYVIEMTADDIIKKCNETQNCPWCGVELDWYGTINNQSRRPTLDRVNNENVIRPDNTQILCSKCNVTKQNRNMKELLDCLTKGIEFCNKYLTSLENQSSYHIEGNQDGRLNVP